MRLLFTILLVSPFAILFFVSFQAANSSRSFPPPVIASAFSPEQIERVETEIRAYEKMIEQWKEEGIHYRSLNLYLGIDCAELLMKELRGELETKREAKIKKLLSDLRVLMQELVAESQKPYQSEEKNDLAPLSEGTLL